ncbi:helix-turn-helix transcriptional regulator [Nonomuraea sp. C10]|uniref:helix-turn-helix domain-containing protein n=1 Tax=Nonomuraea sp. C10 TaxID=2600577 RepID=UPI0011CDC6BE|nr:helix-turn-helix transcriptional regulator [Nonomuraea sp. C10]TXK34632.1 helix-turn-helix transcriptional regulator [Nonomuraea sp. C10]
MGTFEELVDRLAAALDEAAEGIREALRSQGRPQKYLANRVADASPSLISRWLSGARQLADRNRLPGEEAMRQIATALELPPERARTLIALGGGIDELRRRLEGEERGWRARAAEHRGREAALQPAPAPRRSVPLLTAAVATATVAVISFLGGVLAGRSWGTEPPPSVAATVTAGQGAGDRCSTWADAGDGVQLEACVRIREGRMLIRSRLRGPVGTRADMVVQAYDTFLEKPVTKELKCHRMHLTSEGQIQTCGWHEIRPPYGPEYAARAGWRAAGDGPFGGHVLSSGLRW